jgi:O-antigen/teichoic acid export membrane protein
MRRKFLHDISANSLQVIISQVCGLVIFSVLSLYFSKNDFGEINWSLAVLLASFTILSLGIDQVMVQKIAVGEDPQKILSIYFFHVIAAGLIFYFLLLMIVFFFPAFQQNYRLLLFLGIGKLMIFFASPFKQLANGLEKFRALFIMSICSNIVRAAALLYFTFFSTLNLTTVIVIFITGDLTELLLSYFITKKALRVSFSNQWTAENYFSLLKASLPQAGVVVFTSAIARFDWIFLGILASDIALAEYSFAYKVFEVATLPLLVIAPFLVPRFTKLFHNDAKINMDGKINDLLALLRFEIIAASLIALILNILWAPVIDFITQGKYGAANRYTILVLSACMPFIYVNNFLWSIHFSQSRFKMIFYIFFITFLVNVTGDIILIPLFAGEGAAFAYLGAILLQFIMFRVKSDFILLKQNIVFVICPTIAFVSGYLSFHTFDNTWWQLISALLIFFLLLIFSRLIRRHDWSILRRIFQF